MQIRLRKQSCCSQQELSVLISGYGEDSVVGAGATLWPDAQALSYSPFQSLPNLPPQHRGHPGLPLSQKEEGSEVKPDGAEVRRSTHPPLPTQELTSPFHAQALLPQLL